MSDNEEIKRYWIQWKLKLGFLIKEKEKDGIIMWSLQVKKKQKNISEIMKVVTIQKVFINTEL